MVLSPHGTHASTSAREPSPASRASACTCFAYVSARWAQTLHQGEPTGRVHTGLVSKLWAGRSPAPPAMKRFLMALVIIPRFLSLRRFLGRPRLLTRVAAPPLSGGLSIRCPHPRCVERGPRSIPSRWQHIIAHALACDVPALSAAGKGGVSLPRGLTPVYSNLELPRRKHP